jgi:hypothetical protein
MRIAIYWLLLSIATAAPFGRAAVADDALGFVQITCAPELSYLSVRRFFIMNVPSKADRFDPDPAVVAAVERNYGIFQSAGLQKRPFECSVAALAPAPGWDFDRRPAGQCRSPFDVSPQVGARPTRSGSIISRAVQVGTGRPFRRGNKAAATAA